MIKANLGYLGEFILLFEKHWGVLAKIWHTLQLVIKSDELKIHDFYNGQKYSSFGHDILYHYVKTCQ
jgi:hypothetical protein